VNARQHRLTLCGVVISSSWHDPVACAFPPDHDGNHSWASIPALPPLDPNEAVTFWLANHTTDEILAAGGTPPPEEQT
jgi:hypothetical protein